MKEDKENLDPALAGAILTGSILEKAEAGDVECQYIMGLNYLNKVDREPENQERGIKFLRAAAEAGHGKAQYLLGELMLTGEFELPEDPVMGEVWIRKAISNKEPDAYVALWRAIRDGYIQGTSQEAVAALRQGMEAGSTVAVSELGILYMNQAKAIAEQDKEESKQLTQEGLKFLKIAVEDGDLRAALYLEQYEEELRKEKGKKKKSAHGKKNRNKGK